MSHQERQQGCVTSQANESSGPGSSSKMAIPDWHSPGQATLIHLGRLKVRPIQFHQFWNQNTDPPNQLVPLFQSIKAILQWWQVLEPPPFTHHLLTDASKKGWEAYLQDTTCQGTWSQLQTQLDINNLEMRAIKLALSHFNIPAMSHVLVESDNTTDFAFINRVGGTRSWSVWKEIESLFLLPGTLNISISTC